MPYVNIKVTKENGEPTVAQKEELIKGVTELLHTVLGRNRASTVVIIDEIETENYGLGGESIKIKRKREEKR
ncbi:4-oxalocrotonate tautomerase family protein [Campylobacter fetus]|uniref:Tautomerase n=3 Tax=Campylobacter fetus TaxID=196 RepID=A0A5L4IGX9_CAMFE|nr:MULTISPECIES: 4-oxalocrotonate tautomerase family protein [Campylobacter]OCS22177.1 tautomerase [Campylobacter fetus subsp. venerealis cfvi97/532]OCS26999.1 tautomerase [Campylobacter fetus subsp. venerealis cfvB10]OCS30131.1 tautomerase [Campylobacter fetus subsp. venerealis LMG 6570 = CCUG 33900]OCS43353.1 tautomerase [Campylobacter fetus subsp. venerealis cfvi02/298]ABK82390.1 conserved domain protein [Campylobacter fetus subsp. fetus 82-40]